MRASVLVTVALKSRCSMKAAMSPRQSATRIYGRWFEARQGLAWRVRNKHLFAQNDHIFSINRRQQSRVAITQLIDLLFSAHHQEA